MDCPNHKTNCIIRPAPLGMRTFWPFADTCHGKCQYTSDKYQCWSILVTPNLEMGSCFSNMTDIICQNGGTLVEMLFWLRRNYILTPLLPFYWSFRAERHSSWFGEQPQQQITHSWLRGEAAEWCFSIISELALRRVARALISSQPLRYFCIAVHIIIVVKTCISSMNSGWRGGLDVAGATGREPAEGGVTRRCRHLLSDQPWRG